MLIFSVKKKLLGIFLSFSITFGFLSTSLAADSIQIYRGFNYPTSFDFLPDGDILVATKSGEIYLVDKDSGNSTLVLDIEDKVNSNGDRGLLTLRVNKWNQPNVLVYYVVDSPFLMDPSTSKDLNVPTVARLSEFSWDEDESVLDPLSERIILGTDSNPNCVSEISPSPTCIPATTNIHNGGGLDFGNEENSIYLGIGDDGNQYPDLLTLRAQNLDSYNGKILKINSTNGQGFSTNPFAEVDDLGSVRSKIFALGLRNPFRISTYPNLFDDEDRVFIGDVGLIEWEEINSALGGENFGWPCFEGNVIPLDATSGFTRTRPSAFGSICNTLIQDPPLRALSHPGYNSITLGPVLTRDSLTTLHSVDYATKKYYTLDLLDEGAEILDTTFNVLSNDIGNVVDLRFDSSETLWFLDIIKGGLSRLDFEGIEYTDEISPYDIEIILGSPEQLLPGQSIQFIGSITDKEDDTVIDVNRYMWSSQIVHCEPVCHFHPDANLLRASSGNFLMPEFHAASYVELSLSVFGTAGVKYSNSIRIDWLNFSGGGSSGGGSSGGGGGSGPAPTLPNISASGTKLVLSNPLRVKDSYFKSLDANQLGSISVSQFAKLPVKTLKLLTPIQVSALTFDQLKALKPAQVVALKPDVIAVLNSTQIAALQPADFKRMKTAQISRISGEAAAGLAKSDLNSFSRTQLRSLNTEAVKGLKPEVLKSFSVNKLSQFSPRQIKVLTDEQKSALTKTQKSALRIN